MFEHTKTMIKIQNPFSLDAPGWLRYEPNAFSIGVCKMTTNTENITLSLEYLPHETEGNKVWFNLGGLSVDDFAAFLNLGAGNREQWARDLLLKAKAKPRVLIDPAVFGVSIPKEQQTLQMVRVTRGDALAALKGRFAGLSVGDSYAVGKLDRTLHNPAATDRFVSLANLIDGIKSNEAIAGLWLAMIEIDDPALEIAADFGGEPAIEAIAREHIEKATKAMGLFTSPDGKTPAPYPFLATYSGKKSVHCLWYFEGGLKKADWEKIKESKAEVFTPGLKIRFPELAEIDPLPLFSGHALARIPCEIPEHGRRPQIGWRTGSFGKLSTWQMVEIAEKRLEYKKEKYRIRQLQAEIYSKSQGKDQRNQPITENTLISLGINFKNRNGGGWLITCPTHEDQNPSAFCTENGFVWCAVCCGSGQTHCARITPNGIEKQ